MQTCEITGRIHRNRRELAAELARLDKLIASMEAVVTMYKALFDDEKNYPIAEAVGDAWNAAHDAVDRLKMERSEVEWNPRPIPASEAGTYALIQQNID